VHCVLPMDVGSSPSGSQPIGAAGPAPRGACRRGHDLSWASPFSQLPAPSSPPPATRVPSSCSATTQYCGTEMPWLMCRRLGPADAAKDGVPFAAENHPCGVSLDGPLLVNLMGSLFPPPITGDIVQVGQVCRDSGSQPSRPLTRSPKQLTPQHKKYARQTRKAMSIILQEAMAILLLRG
jgi:hypothetical protein